MAEERLEHDEEFREACRVSAWGEQPADVRDRHWDADAGQYRFPDGWPEGVDPFEYVAEAAGAESAGETYLHRMMDGLRGGKAGA